jgi:hypothetical protein
MTLLDDVLPDDVRDSMVAHVWKGAQAEIQLAITAAVIEELHVEIRTRARRRVRAELDRSLGPAVEASLVPVRQVAERIVELRFDRVDEEALARLQVAMTFRLGALFDRVSRELAPRLTETPCDTIEEDADRCREQSHPRLRQGGHP